MSRQRWLRKMAFSLLFSLGGSLAHGLAQQPMPAEPIPAPSSEQAHKPATLDLAGCLGLAEQRQPRLAAARASLAAAEDGKRALDNLHPPPLVGRELPVRRHQASLGVTAVTAALDVAERDAIYGVTRAYLTVLYAREQKEVARKVVLRLNTTYTEAKRQLDAGETKSVTDADVKRTLTYLRLAESKLVQAEHGSKRALVALREAVGLGPCWDLDVRGTRLPLAEAVPNRCEVVALALARRGELIQAKAFAEIAGLEVEAQGTSMLKRMQTFAAGSDIHSRQVPQEISNSEYRPGGVPPEYPTLLAGSRDERMKHAESLHARAGAVVEVTRNLIVLETEDAFLRWEDAKGEAAKAREAADVSAENANNLDVQYSRQKVTVKDLVDAHVLASQAESQYIDQLYRQILALADLERATAGGFCAGLVGAPPRPLPTPKKKKEEPLFP